MSYLLSLCWCRLKTWGWWVLARFHLNDQAVCDLSKGSTDYHDYVDDEHGVPWHFTALKCKRCGKEFWI